MEHDRDNNLELEKFLAVIEGRAFRLAQIATGNRDDALELVQEAMIKLIQKYAHRHADEWSPLFYSILQSRIRDWHRRQMVRNRFRAWLPWFEEEGAEDPIEQIPSTHHTGDPAVQLENNQFGTRLEQELNSLPYRQQQAFLLRVWEGMDITQTAEVMQCSESSVKTHQARALKKLRTQLGAFR